MLNSIFRYLLWLMILLLILSLLSFMILLRDPLNGEWLKQDLMLSYLNYVKSLLQGDLGITYNGGESLAELIFTVLPPTLELCFTALLLAILIGVPLGLASAVLNWKVFSRIIESLTIIGLSIPVFWLAPILLYFATWHSWEISAVGQYNLLYEITPITGFPVIDVWFMQLAYQIKVVQNILQHLALPTLILSILPTVEIIRLIQQRATYVLNQNYSKMAFTRGWSKGKILQRYVIRNSFPLLVPQMTRIFTLALTQCMLVETSIGWPGIGRWLINAVTQQDYNSIAAAMLVIGICIIFIDSLTKIIRFLLDPLNKKGWYAS